jgi:Na+/melibiose symporter-like transporter
LTNKSILTSEIFINFLVAGICLGIAIICLIVWQTNKKKHEEIISQIKNKPKYKLPSTKV